MTDRDALLRDQITRIINSFGTLRAWDDGSRNHLIENLTGGVAAYVIAPETADRDADVIKSAKRLLRRYKDGGGSPGDDSLMLAREVIAQASEIAALRRRVKEMDIESVAKALWRVAYEQAERDEMDELADPWDKFGCDEHEQEYYRRQARWFLAALSPAPPAEERESGT